MRVKSSASFSGSGWANSTNSKPSVPAGLAALITAFGALCGKGPMGCLLSILARIVRQTRRNELAIWDAGCMIYACYVHECGSACTIHKSSAPG